MSKIHSLVFASALLLAAPIAAFAHAYPKTMEPAPNSTVDSPPKEVVITFTQDLIPSFSSLEVVNSQGKRVDQNDAHLASKDHKEFIVELSALKPGTYKVIWRVTSVDTHKTHGSYDFKVTE